MAAGLGFKDFLTGEVLTAADVDGYLMQGVWVFASAAARDAAVTSPQEGNFAYLKDTNVTTYYTGSAWANLDTTGMTNPMTTTGDTIYSSSGSTPARLGIGTAGQVLQVNSGATAPEWATPGVAASGLTLVKSQTIGSAVSSVTVTDAFSATYTNYRIVVSADSQSANAILELKLGSTTSNYYTVGFYQEFGTATVNGFQSSNSAFFYSVYGGTNGTSGVIEILKPQVAARTSFTSISASPTTTGLASVYNGFLNDATQYTAFTLTPNSGTITGGQVRVYGYQNS